jgi:hypothetical protein
MLRHFENLQACACCDTGEVPVIMDQGEVVFNGHGRDQTVNRLSDGSSLSRTGLEDVRRMYIGGDIAGMIEREREEILLNVTAHLIIADALQDLGKDDSG